MKDLRTFTGGADYDNDIRYIGQEDYIEALNVSSGTSVKGSLQNMLGNRLINFTLPAGDNTCIGSLRNIQENSIIYFVYNSLGNHSILEYYCETKTIDPILIPFTSGSISFTTSFLGFTRENKIHSSNILDNIVTWTDNNVSPRKINKQRAKDFLAQLTPSSVNIPYDNLIATGTDQQKIQFIEFIKYKPSAQPSIGLGFDVARKTNYLREKMVQAKYRYIYDDNEYSRWSDGSWVTLPQGMENASGLLSNTNNNNYAIITLNTGHPTVKAIEIAVRFGNTQVWGKLDTQIKKYDQDNQRLIADYINYEYNFYNDSILIELIDELDNYDSVPQLCKTQEIVDGNRMVFGNNVEGYQNPSLNTSSTYENFRIDMGAGLHIVPDNGGGSIPTDDLSYWNTSIGNPNFQFSIPYLIPSYMQVGSVVYLRVNRKDASTYDLFYDFYYTVTQDDVDGWGSHFTYALAASLQSTCQFIAPLLIGGGGGAFSIRPAGFFISNGEYATIITASVIPPTQKIQSWKRGAWLNFGIVYKDIQGRDGGVATNQGLNLYMPYLPEIYSLQALDNQYAYRSLPQLTLAHQPPEWAVEYEIVYALNNLQKYTQFLIKAGSKTRINAQGNYEIDCTYIIDYITKERIETSVDFQFEPGDNLRFISNADSYVQEYIEVKVLAFDTTTNVLTVSPYSTDQVTASMLTPTQEGVLCELFAYKKTGSSENRPYFAIGETYTIGDAGLSTRFHRANKQTQSGSTPAIVQLSRGDCYIFRRYFSNNTLEAMVESENFSDIYASKNIDISSVYAVIPEGKTKRYEQGLRYGGRYFPNTNTNNLCQFNGSDYDTLNTRYGPINKMATIGYTLKVLQTKKNTSIYIDRNMIFNANGDSQLTLTDKVLGNKNPSELDYGCDNPESVCIDDRQLYFYDVNNGAFIQDSANGMIPISEYKAKTYFRNISDKIKSASNIYVYAHVDNFNSYVNVTFVDENTVPVIDNQTIVYHTMDNRWKSRMSYIPEYYGGNALVFVSFKDGNLYEHNSTLVPRNNFYGIQYSSKVKFAANMDFPKIKTFMNIAVYSNKTFYSPNDTDITIPSSVNYPSGMRSRLLANAFRWKEGVSYASYLRDLLTPNAANPILTGRKLRGEVLVQQLQNDDTDAVTLYSVIVHSAESELSK